MSTIGSIPAYFDKTLVKKTIMVYTIRRMIKATPMEEKQ